MTDIKLKKATGIFISMILFIALFNGYPSQAMNSGSLGVSAAANLVSNPGFESGKSSWYELGESTVTALCVQMEREPADV